MSDLSKAALLKFLDYLSSKGLMNKTTVAARRAAANNVLGILDEDEASDVSRINIDEVMNRFINLRGSEYTPESLNSYKSRLKASIDDFLRYQNDPLNFKPSTQPIGRRMPDGSRAESPQQPKPSRREKRLPAEVPEPPASVSILPVPIRADLTIKIQGLPYDLTEAEATKIANVVRAMATTN